MPEELIKRIEDWIQRYEETEDHDGEFNMDAKDFAYSILEDVLISAKK